MLALTLRKLNFEAQMLSNKQMFMAQRTRISSKSATSMRNEMRTATQQKHKCRPKNEHKHQNNQRQTQQKEHATRANKDTCNTAVQPKGPHGRQTSDCTSRPTPPSSTLSLTMNECCLQGGRLCPANRVLRPLQGSHNDGQPWIQVPRESGFPSSAQWTQALMYK